MLDQLDVFWDILKNLPGEVWLRSLFLFVLLGLAKGVGVVRKDGWAAGANTVLAIIMNGGFDSFDDLGAALKTSATAVIAAFYYQIWKLYVKEWVMKFVALVQSRLK